MFRLTASLACGIAFAVCTACGDDGSSTSPVGTSGTGAQAGTAAAGTSAGAAGGAARGGAGSSAGRGAAGVGPSAGRSAAGTGAAGRGSAGTGVQDDDDAGVKPGTAGTGAAGAAGSAGAAAGSGGASGSAAGAGGASGAAGSGTGAGATFTEVYAIFQQSCAGATCHVMATRAGEGLAMTDKMTAYMNLVGVNAGACSGEKRVVAGDPAKSELLHTLERTQIGMCRNTPRMPEGKPMLAADQIAKVRSWIQAGAKND